MKIELTDEWVRQTVQFKLINNDRFVRIVHGWMWERRWMAYVLRIVHNYILSVGFISMFLVIPFPLFVLSYVLTAIYIPLRMSLYHVGLMKLLAVNLEYLFHCALIGAQVISVYFIIDLYSSLAVTCSGLITIFVFFNADLTRMDMKIFFFGCSVTMLCVLAVLVCFFFGLDRLEDYNIDLFGKNWNLRLFFIDKYVFFSLLFIRLLKAKVQDENANFFLYHRVNYGVE